MKTCHTLIVSTEERKEGRAADTERWEGEREKERQRRDLCYNVTNVVSLSSEENAG